MSKSTTLVSTAVSALIYVFATPVGADYSTGSAMRDAPSRETDLGTALTATELWVPPGSAARLQKPVLFAWCEAMGGYPSFEAQARAQKRAEAQRRADKQRASSQQIIEDQKALQRFGYYTGSLDGIQGPMTSRAIANFREAHSLGTGTKLDAKSREILYGVNVLPKATWESRNTTKVIQADQQALADLGYYSGPVNGQQNPKMLAAIREFKQKHGIDASNNTLDSTSRAALLEAQAEVRWLRSANGDGVSIIMATPRNGAYRMRTANGDYSYEVDGVSKILTLIAKIESKGVQKVYIDVSKLSTKNLESFKNTLRMRPKSSVHFLEKPSSRELVFSRNINVVEASPPTQLATGHWLSTLTLSSAKAANYVLHVIGKTKDLTVEAVRQLRATMTRSTLAGALNSVRKDLKKAGKIKSDEDLKFELRRELDGTIEILSVPTRNSVRDA